ncbi:MAG: methyltransferase [Planctomycetota bacterium]
MPLKTAAYGLVHPLLRRARRSRWLVRRLFGVRLPPGADVAFDPTTVLLARAVNRFAESTDRTCFEVGIGAGALVSLAFARRRARAGEPISVAGCDCVPRRVASAQAVAAYNALRGEFFHGDLFGGVGNRRFDLILFNPPYVPTAVGEALRLNTRLTDERAMWDGGSDGLAVLREFLAQAPRRLAPGGRVLFGVQHVFVADGAVRAAINASPLRLVQAYRRFGVPAEVYVAQG